MLQISFYLLMCLVCVSQIKPIIAEMYTYEDVELRRIFPNEFLQDTVLKSGSLDPEHLGRYNELRHYFLKPKDDLNSHFEELACYDEDDKKICRIDGERYSLQENKYYMTPNKLAHDDRRRVYCLMLLCFNEDELGRVVASFPPTSHNIKSLL